MSCGSGDLSVESHDQVFSNGFESSNVLNLGGNVAGQASSDQLSRPSLLMAVIRPLGSNKHQDNFSCTPHTTQCSIATSKLRQGLLWGETGRAFLRSLSTTTSPKVLTNTK